jgi:3-oxoacyl-[acyl-carrier protein] reductase
MRLKEKVALVTGGGAGIGRGIVLTLAREGSSVGVLDLNREAASKTAKEAEAFGVGARPLFADVSSQKEVEGAVIELINAFGKIDILVNNAGISLKRQGLKIDVVDMTLAEWEKVIAVNLGGVFICCKAILPGMIERKYGRIINISSTAAKTGGLIAGASYSASKAGILALTKAVAREVARFGITVNAIMPGRILTEMGSSSSESKLKERLAQTPLGRFGKPEEIGEAVVFLSCDQSGSWITGATLNVSGGVHMD